MTDLAAQLIRAIESNRDVINASRIAQGEPGRIEIQVNPSVCRIELQVLVRDKSAA